MPAPEDAERWIAARPYGAPEPTKETIDFITQSRRAANQRLNLLTGSLAAGLAVALILAGLTFWQCGVALEQERLANEQRDRAEKNEAQAKQERDRALLAQSRLLADQANQRVGVDDADTGLLLALEALPDTGAQAQRPYASEAEVALFGARQRLRRVAVLSGHDDRVTHVVFGPDGTKVASSSSDELVRIWDTQSGRTTTVLQHDGDVWSVEFSPDGEYILSAVPIRPQPFGAPQRAKRL